MELSWSQEPAYTPDKVSDVEMSPVREWKDVIMLYKLLSNAGVSSGSNLKR